MWNHFYCAGALDVSVVLSIFVASVRAVGCAATLAAAGLWLARRGLMTPQLSKGLSQLSVKLALPALLFSSVVPGMSMDVLGYAWPLVFLPMVYLVIGAVIGGLMLVIVRPPPEFRFGTVAACTFGNTTGIPVVVLHVLQQSLSRSVFADITDPLLFLSLMLVVFPLMQWLAGLALLTIIKGRSAVGGSAGGCTPCSHASLAICWCCSCGVCGECGEGEGDEGGMGAGMGAAMGAGMGASMGAGDLEAELLRQNPPSRPIRRGCVGEESTSYISMMSQGEDYVVTYEDTAMARPSSVDRLYSLLPPKQVAVACYRRLVGLLQRIFVPQTVGIIGGAVVGLLGRSLVLPPETAPLGWLYLGVTKLGNAAVPINLILLGAALSRTPEAGQLPSLTAAGITVARLILMPLCGLGVAKVLMHFVQVPYMVADPFWLVCLILTCTPTANNIVVMCDLAGENRRAMSAAIFYQYCAAPLILPIILTLFVAFICGGREADMYDMT